MPARGHLVPTSGSTPDDRTAVAGITIRRNSISGAGDGPRRNQTFIRELLRWARENGRSFPWRTTEDPFRILVAEVLLQRSRGTTVARVYEELFTRWPTPQALAGASVDAIAAVIKPLGLVKRAATLRSLAEQVADSGMPSTVEGLEHLPGVGRYAANAATAGAFGLNTAAVDSVSARVYRRVFAFTAEREGQVDDRLWRLVEEVSPRKHLGNWNWAVLDLAATVCLPARPRCEQCPVVMACRYAEGRVRG